MPRLKGLQKDQFALQKTMQQTVALLPNLRWKGRSIKRRSKQANQELEKLIVDIDNILANAIKMKQGLELIQKASYKSQKQMIVLQEIVDRALSSEDGKLKEKDALLLEVERKKGLSMLNTLEEVAVNLQETCEKARDEYFKKHHTLVDRIKLYAFAIDRLSVSFDDLKEEDVIKLIPDYKLFIAEKNRKELSNEESAMPSAMGGTNHVRDLSKKKRKQQKYRSKQKAKALALTKQPAALSMLPQREAFVRNSQQVVGLSPEQQFLGSLNHPSYPLKYSEASRCVRWRKKGNPNEFADRSGGEIVYHYQGMTKEALDLVIKQHKLHGVDRVLSNPEAVRRYGLSYSWRNDKGVLQVGIKLQAIMHLPDSRSFLGEIRIGFNPETNVIFHAMFEPLDMNEVSNLNTYREPLEEISLEEGLQEDVKDGMKEGKEDGQQWENVSPVTFNSGKNSSLLWEIGKQVQEKVTFELVKIRE